MFKEKPKSKKKLKQFFSRVGAKTRRLFARPEKETKSSPWKRIGLITLFILLLLILTSLVVFTVGIYGFKWENRPAQVAKQIIPFPASVVGFRAITINQVEKEAGHIEHFYQKSGAGKSNLPNKEVIKNQVLDRLIEDQVINSLSRKYKVDVEAKEVEDQFQKIVEDNGGEEKVKTLLEDLYDLSVPEFKNLIEKQLEREKLKQKFEDELRLKAQTRHILIKVGAKASKKEKKRALSLAKKILKQARKKDADFAKLAKKYSQDKATKDKGGSLPWFGQGDMVKPFEEATFKLDIGGVSPIVKSSYGYHIIQLEDKRGSIEENFNDWVDKIKKGWLVWKLIKW